MGNAHSAGAAHTPQQNRLSKPKTNKNSPSPLPKVESLTAISTKYVPPNSKDRQHIKSQLTTDFGQHTSAAEDEGVGDLSTNLQRRLSSMSKTNSLSCFGGSKSTSSLTSLPGSRISLVSNGQVVDLETAIKIVHEVKRNASPEDLAVLQQAIQASAPCPSPRPSPQPDPVLSRRTSTVTRSSSSLIRRRSLVTTPGVAMRNLPVDGIRRTWHSWKTPKVDSQEEAKWRVNTMGNSPITRIAALDLAEEGRGSPVPRAQTPGEMDYSHLGSLRLGSLRVTNGAASPAPYQPDASWDEDYFTSSEAGDSPIMMKPTKRTRHNRSKSAAQPSTPPIHRSVGASTQARRAKTMSRYDSLLQVQTQNLTILGDEEPEPVRRLRVMNKSVDTLARADALAKDYQTEIPKSPFQVSHPGQWGLYDEFASDDTHSSYEEVFRLLNGSLFNEPTTKLEPPQSQVQSPAKVELTTEQPKYHMSIMDRPRPKKADSGYSSGYSSGGSVRTIERPVLKEGTVPTLSKKPSIVADILQSGSSDSDDSSSIYTFDQMLHLHGAVKPLSPGPADETVGSGRRPSQISLSQVAELKSRGIDIRFLDDGLPKTPGSIVSQGSVDSKSSSQKRLQKRRPSHQETPVIQSCEPIPELAVPSIPADVRANFVRRMSETPGMDCLTRTYPSKEHVTSEETTADYPVALFTKVPPSPKSPEARGRHHRRSATERPSSSQAGGIRQSLSLFRSKSKTRKEKQTSYGDENASPAVVDLGNIATSLGRSPYDAVPATTSWESATPPSNTYQLGAALPRARSTVHMGAGTTAEFARMHGNDQTHVRPELPQRPRSQHDTLKKHPQSFYDDYIPSVPPVASRYSTASTPTLRDPIEQQAPINLNSGPGFRARTTGRGPVVSQMVDKYDQNGQPIIEQMPINWQTHSRLWTQRRKSVGEGLRQRAEESQARSYAMGERSMSQSLVVDRYGGGFEDGYQGRSYGFGGSAGTRQLHSYASRKSMHHSSHYGMDLSDVPPFAQRV